MSDSTFSGIEVTDHVKINSAPGNPTHAVRGVELSARCSPLEAASHAAASMVPTTSVDIGATGQQFTPSVKRKTTGLASDEGLLGVGANGVFVKLGTTAGTAAAGNHTHEGGGLPVATKAEAELGEVNNKTMTPLRTKEAIAALGGGPASTTPYDNGESPVFDILNGPVQFASLSLPQSLSILGGQMGDKLELWITAMGTDYLEYGSSVVPSESTGGSNHYMQNGLLYIV